MVSYSWSAKLLVGDLGNVARGARHTFDKVFAKDKAWEVAGNMEGKYATDLLK